MSQNGNIEPVRIKLNAAPASMLQYEISFFSTQPERGGMSRAEINVNYFYTQATSSMKTLFLG